MPAEAAPSAPCYGISLGANASVTVDSTGEIFFRNDLDGHKERGQGEVRCLRSATVPVKVFTQDRFALHCLDTELAAARRCCTMAEAPTDLTDQHEGQRAQRRGEACAARRDLNTPRGHCVFLALPGGMQPPSSPSTTLVVPQVGGPLECGA